MLAPFAHQTEAERRLAAGTTVNPAVYPLLMEMGTGKSRPVVRHWWSLVAQSIVDDLLIVAPKGCYLNWTTDTKNPAAEPGEIDKWLEPGERARVTVAVWASGMGKRASADLDAFLGYRGPRRRVLLMNVEALSSPGRARAVLETYLRSRRVMWVIDESTCIMHEDSSRTDFVLKMRELAYYRYILTGLVSPENPMNVFWQFWWLDWRILGHRSHYGFQARYAITQKTDYRPLEVKERTAKKVPIVLYYHRQSEKAWAVSKTSNDEPKWVPKRCASRRERRPDGLYQFTVSDWWLIENGFMEGKTRGVDVIVSYRNLEELEARIAANSFRVLADDVLDLPPETYGFRDVEMTEQQARMYDEMRRFATTELEGKFITAEMKMHQIQKMHEMLCGHARDEEGALIDIPSRRVDELMTLLQDHSGKAIIWAPYPRALEKIVDALKAAYGDRSVVGFWGATSAADRQDAKHRIQRADDTRFIVANQAVGGEGNTWTQPNLTVFFANSRKNKDRQQSEKRMRRPGQTQHCHFIDLRVRGTVDEKWVAAIRSKMDLSDALTGDNYKEWLV